MKFTAALLLTLGLLAGSAQARTINNTFTDLNDAAPHSVFDQLSDAAPLQPFDRIGDAAPRAATTDEGVKADLASE